MFSGATFKVIIYIFAQRQKNGTVVAQTICLFHFSRHLKFLILSKWPFLRASNNEPFPTNGLLNGKATKQHANCQLPFTFSAPRGQYLSIYIAFNMQTNMMSLLSKLY